MSVTHRSDELAFSALDSIGLCVGETLGTGAMSTVYAVTRRSSATAVPLALKLLHLEHAGHLELVLRFVNERHAAERVRHPGVVRVYVADLVQGRPYLVMERLSRTLADGARSLSFSERVDVMSQIAHGAAALHAAGVVHRELMQEIFPSQSIHYIFGGKAGGRTQQWSYFWLRLSIEYFWFYSFA